MCNINGEYIDGVFVTDDTARFRTNRHLSQSHNHLATHYYSASWYLYQFMDDAYATTDDVNALIVTMQNLDRNFGSRLSGQPFDYGMLLDLGDHHTHQQEEEEIIMLKTRIHCAKVEVDDSEICSICLCEYVNGETMGILECGHEFHATCIEQWLLRGKKNCPICRSEVLSSPQRMNLLISEIVF